MSGSGAGRGQHGHPPGAGHHAAVTGVVVALTAMTFAAVATPGILADIQRVDDAWLRLIAAHRLAPVTDLALVLNLLGSVAVTLPVRLAVAGHLALRRSWWHLASFVSAVVTSELLIGVLKVAYGRDRAPGSLVSTTGASFPSGHAVAASVTVVAAVIALVPPGRRRAAWGALAVAFSLLMALSRAYLGAHWMSDAIAGVLLGTSCALVASTGVGALAAARRAPERIRVTRGTATLPLAPPEDRP